MRYDLSPNILHTFALAIIVNNWKFNYNNYYVLVHQHARLCVDFAKSPLLQPKIIKACNCIAVYILAFPGAEIYHSIGLMLCTVRPIFIVQESEASLCSALLDGADATDLSVTGSHHWCWCCCGYSIHWRFHSSEVRQIGEIIILSHLSNSTIMSVDHR